MSTLRVLHPREASIFAALCEVFVAPVPPLPPVHRTDAAFALDDNLAAAPPLNRAGLRVGLLALEVAPRALGYGRRLRALDLADRTAAVERLGRGPLADLVKALRGVAHLCYYGDPAVMRILGYDADRVVRRAAALRMAEARW